MLTEYNQDFFVQQSVSLQQIIRYEVLISQKKVLDMKMMVEWIIVEKLQLIIKSWVSELAMVDRKSDKEAENCMLLPKFPLFQNIMTFEVLGDAQIFFGIL